MDSPGNKKEDTSLVKIWEYLSDSNLSVLPGSCCSLAAFVKRGVTVFVVMKVADRIDDGGNRKQWLLSLAELRCALRIYDGRCWLIVRVRISVSPGVGE